MREFAPANERHPEHWRVRKRVPPGGHGYPKSRAEPGPPPDPTLRSASRRADGTPKIQKNMLFLRFRPPGFTNTAPVRRSGCRERSLSRAFRFFNFPGVQNGPIFLDCEARRNSPRRPENDLILSAVRIQENCVFPWIARREEIRPSA